MSLVRSRGTVVVAAAAVLAFGAGTGAVAGSLITSKDIKNRTIQAADLSRGSVTTNKIKNGTVKPKDLNKELNDRLAAGGVAGPAGLAGAKGAEGSQGPQGPAGPNGTATYASPNWQIIDRNVIGNGDSYLRSGPTSKAFGADVAPPMGIGSLGIRTGSPEDQTSFGNQVDFAGDTLASVTSVSFWEYTTGENVDKYAHNAASVSFEIAPTGTGYSSLNFVTRGLLPNQWNEVNTDSANWFLTGGVGTSTGCNQTTYCTLEEVKAKLPDATLYTAQIGKGRDYAFSGAVDALQIGDTVYDFEPFGVIETAAN